MYVVLRVHLVSWILHLDLGQQYSSSTLHLYLVYLAFSLLSVQGSRLALALSCPVSSCNLKIHDSFFFSARGCTSGLPRSPSLSLSVSLFCKCCIVALATQYHDTEMHAYARPAWFVLRSCAYNTVTFVKYFRNRLTLFSRITGNSATAFSGFGDDESGFYKTYERAFREVWDSERDWGEVSSQNGKGAGGGTAVWGQGEPPSMGGSKDRYETADLFYGSWSGFVSGLSFGWADEYNVNEVCMCMMHFLLASVSTCIYIYIGVPVCNVKKPCGN